MLLLIDCWLTALLQWRCLVDTRRLLDDNFVSVVVRCLRSCAIWVAVCRSTFISSRRSRIVSIHRFFGLPRLIIPLTYPFMEWEAEGFSYGETCHCSFLPHAQKNFIRLCWILWITSCFQFNLLWISELPVSEMTYTVSSGTLNSTIPYQYLS